MTHPGIARARAEQETLAALLKSGHPEREGIMLAISDWFWEEVLIEQEVCVFEPRGERGASLVRHGGQEQSPGATLDNCGAG